MAILHQALFFFFLAALGPHCCEWDLSLVVQSGGYSVVAMHRLLIAVNSLVAKHRI